MFNLGMPELLLILVIALVVFGPGKLPDIGKAMGKSIQEFRRATSGEPLKEEPSRLEERPEDRKPAEKQADEKK